MIRVYDVLIAAAYRVGDAAEWFGDTLLVRRNDLSLRRHSR